MRIFFIAIFSVAVLTLSVYFGEAQRVDKVAVTIRLVNAATGKSMSGIVRVVVKDKAEPLKLAGLLHRLRGLEKAAPVKGWYVVPARGGKTILPPGEYQMEAVAGLETAIAKIDIDLRRRATAEVSLKLHPIIEPDKLNLVAGNTHLHLRNMTLKNAEDYLRQIPAADQLKVLFISHLLRHKDDEHYITNQFPIGDLKQFDVTGVLINNGEEHRHNFKGFGAGYGHVMLLDIKRLIEPVSIGPGIMAKGFDDRPLRTGIDEARKQGGTIIWCHNTFGHEDILNALTGRMDAMNVFDGSRRDKYEDTYYHYLNIGLRVPISTGTDWFMYDFSRVYARLKGKLTIKNWLQAVKDCRCMATNGPLLELKIDGSGEGGEFNLKNGVVPRFTGGAIGRSNFEKMELIHNGKVIKTIKAQRKKGYYQASFADRIAIADAGWYALRINTEKKNILGQSLYAHTSPIYVRMKDRRCFNVDSARELIQQLEEGRAAIKMQGTFSNASARVRVLALYDAGIDDLRARINQRK